MCIRDRAYGEHVVLEGVDLVVRRGEKIGIIGVNGAGKTTLLRAIAGEIPIESGSITFGNKVKVGYYAQHHADTLRPDRTLFQEVAAEDPAAGQTRVRSILGAFLFSGDDVDKKVRVLSGGERARVALARLIIRPGNVMLMDEPTNHLDLASAEALAEALSTFDGTLIFVSHNRSFVRRLATKIWNVEDGGVETYPGTLDEYLERHRGLTDARPSATAKPSKAEPVREPVAGAPAVKPVAKPQDDRARRRLEAEQRSQRNRTLGPLKTRVEGLEATIERLEAAQRERNLELAKPEVYADAPRRNLLLTEGARRHEAPLRRFFGRKVPPQDVDEVVQQTWMAMTSNRRRADTAPPEVKSVRAYIFGVARHVVFAYHRKRGEKADFDPEVDSLETLAPSISQQLSLRRNVQRIELAMQSLPLEFQLIAEAHYLEELTGPEIAEMFGIPEGTVRSRLRRAKATIEELMRRWDIRLGGPVTE